MKRGPRREKKKNKEEARGGRDPMSDWQGKMSYKPMSVGEEGNNIKEHFSIRGIRKR